MLFRSLLLACLFFPLAGTPVWADLRDALLVDAADGQWNQHSLVSAGLVASGIDEEHELSHYEHRWRNQVQRLPDALRSSSNDRRALQLLAWMHAEMLRGGYHAGESRLDVLLDEGKYNCVSSVVIYVALAREVQLRTQIISVPDHVYVEVLNLRQPLIIETTSPGAAARPRPTHAQRRLLNEVQVVSIIFYNRATQYFHEEDYSAAAETNLLALRLDPQFSAARKNLLATVNNWAVQLSAAERYAEAQALLRFGLSLAPEDPSLTTNQQLIEQADADAE